MSENFVELKEALLNKNSLQTNLKSGILKNAQVHLKAHKRHIGEEGTKGPKIEPIMKGDFVEGIRIICGCGEITHVYFQYEENGSENQ